jgi:nicotinate-nucleotide pyrophosphorylase (carboxylating)
MFTAAETAACSRLIALALEEDLDTTGDLTSQAVIPEGLPAAALVCAAADTRLQFTPRKQDGSAVTPGEQLATVAGPMRGILAAERTALNFLQRLSGVATQTRHYVEAVAGLPCRILDTRKTTPGWRLLEKYAVRQGGGHNHRLGLYDGILIKDNHLAALGPGTTSITQAVRSARAHAGQSVPLEIEVESLEQLDEALRCGPDLVLLDNMNLEQMREAVRRRNAAAPGVLLEASGGVTLTKLRGIAETGVDRISIGALTHSAVALDIALDYLR